MSTTSADICSAADALQGLVGFNHKQQRHIVRFSEDSFGLDVDEASIQPCAEFVWVEQQDRVMSLSRERLSLLIEQHIDDRLNIAAPLHLYLQRSDLPEILAMRFQR